jgi:hypothetical protein
VNPNYQATLAAAYAECGEFDRAIDCMKSAIQSPALEKEKLTLFQDRIKLFEQHKAYREE